MKIFVSIVSYRDPLLHYTMESIMQNQSQITDVTYAVFEQTVYDDSLEAKYPELLKNDNVIYKRIDPQYSDGVGWARHLNSLQLTDEDFYYQIDSHMLFRKNWDRYLINDYKRGLVKYNDEKIIITSSCGNYVLDENGVPKIQEHGNVRCQAKYFSFHDNYIPGVHGELYPSDGDIHEAFHLFGGNTFTHSDWVKKVGINPKLFFEGEEHYMTLSSFAAGYHLCHSSSINCYHYLETHKYITKQYVDQVVPQKQYNRNVTKSYQEYYRFLDSLDDEIYEEYRKYCGVDYINRKLEERAITRLIRLPENMVIDWEISQNRVE